MKKTCKSQIPEAQKQQEVEIRAILKKEQKNQVFKILEEKGAVFEKSEYLIDAYLCPVSVHSFAEIEMDRIGSYSLRIRKSVSNGQENCQVNTKIITSYGDHNAWEEHEIQVSSYDETMAIFQALGFKVFFTLEKQRTSYRVNNMNIAIEDIVGFGPIVEVEVITSKAEAEEAKRMSREFLMQLGIENHQIVPKSVTNLLMRQKSHF